VFEEAFTKMPYGMEDFLDHGYGTVSRFIHFTRPSHTPVACRLLLYLDCDRLSSQVTDDLRCAQLLDTETKRKVKKEPALAVEMTADLFTCAVGTANEGSGGGDVVKDLWGFL